MLSGNIRAARQSGPSACMSAELRLCPTPATSGAIMPAASRGCLHLQSKSESELPSAHLNFSGMSPS